MEAEALEVKSISTGKENLLDKEDLSMISYFLEKSEAFQFPVCSPLGLSDFTMMIGFLHSSPYG